MSSKAPISEKVTPISLGIISVFRPYMLLKLIVGKNFLKEKRIKILA